MKFKSDVILKTNYNSNMNVDLKILQNGIETKYATCSINFNKEADNIALLIAASKIAKAKHFFVLNKELITDLIDELKINLNKFEITKINWLEELEDTLWKLKNKSVFIFDYYRLRSQPDLSFPNPFQDHASQLVYAEFDQIEYKKVLQNWGSLNNLVFYFAEYEKPISEIIRDESRKFSIIRYINGKKKEEVHYVGPLGKEYHRLSVEKGANEKILEIAIRANKGICIIYPSADEEDVFNSETNSVKELNRLKKFNILLKLILTYFHGRNLANEKVKYPNPVDEKGEIIPDNLLNSYDSKLVEQGLKRIIPTKTQIERTNSYTAIKKYLLYKDSSLLLNDNIAMEIDTFLMNNIDNNNVEFLPVSKNIFDLKRMTFSITENKDIFILDYDSFTDSGFVYDEYEELMAWICCNKRNITFSIINRFKNPN